jgi:hypothetical protein
MIVLKVSYIPFQENPGDSVKHQKLPRLFRTPARKKKKKKITNQGDNNVHTAMHSLNQTGDINKSRTRQD